MIYVVIFNIIKYEITNCRESLSDPWKDVTYRCLIERLQSPEGTKRTTIVLAMDKSHGTILHESFGDRLVGIFM